jgi:crotonobetainyl-CoA:carnitine CoA-transferase CaiB-like acyl-CoA transferase
MELMNHEQVLANQTILRNKYEGFGEVRQAKPAAQFENTPSYISRPAPKLGEHGKEILDSLGISIEAQTKLIDEGKIFISKL